MPLQIEILFQDRDLVVALKPAGVTTHPDGATPPGFDLLTATQRQLGAAYLGVHHRLDREVGGLLAFAARKEANAALARAFEGRGAVKEYLAVVAGAPPRPGSLTTPVDGRPALTHCEVLERRGATSLLRLRIETGRTHQIRVHLAGAGSPILGDAEYGGASFPRLMLHAWRLELPHGRFEAPAPSPFQEPEPLRLGPAGLLRLALDRRAPLAGADCRLVNGEGDGLPGVFVDRHSAEGAACLVVRAPKPMSTAVRDELGSRWPEARFVERPPAGGGRPELREILEWARLWGEREPVRWIEMGDVREAERQVRGFRGSLILWSVEPRLERRRLRRTSIELLGGRPHEELGMFDEPRLDFPRAGKEGILKAFALRLA